MIKNYIQFDQYSGGGGGNNISGPAVVINNNPTELPEEETNQSTNISETQEDTLVLDTLSSKTIDRNFGKVDDYIELHIYNNNNQLIYSEENFKDYSLTLEEPQTTSNNIQIDPNKILTDRNFITGQFRIKLNILRNKIFNS